MLAPSMTRAHAFARQLQQRYKVPVLLVDERSSSVEAAQRFAVERAEGRKRRRDAASRHQADQPGRHVGHLGQGQHHDQAPVEASGPLSSPVNGPGGSIRQVGTHDDGARGIE